MQGSPLYHAPGTSVRELLPLSLLPAGESARISTLSLRQFDIQNPVGRSGDQLVTRNLATRGILVLVVTASVLTIVFAVTQLPENSKEPPKACGVCNSPVVSIASLTDDQSRPSKNIAVWNRSICGNWWYSDGSLICTRCFHAYSPQLSIWERSLENPNDFEIALYAAITQFPLPSNDSLCSRVVYSQVRKGTTFSEDVAFWCDKNDSFLTRVRQYSATNNLKLNIDNSQRIQGEVYLSAKITLSKNPANSDP